MTPFARRLSTWIAALAAALALSGCGYNQFQTLDELRPGPVVAPERVADGHDDDSRCHPPRVDRPDRPGNSTGALFRASNAFGAPPPIG